MQRRWGSSLIGPLTGTQATISPIRPKTLPLDARIREYRPKDKTACVEIYNENEPGRFPAGFGGHFEQFLEHPGYLKLICSIDEGNRVVPAAWRPWDCPGDTEVGAPGLCLPG